MNRLAMATLGAALALTGIALLSGSEAPPAHTASLQTPVASMPSDPDDIKGGVLKGTDADGAVLQFPLEHTDVRAEVTGNVARVELTQIFRNPYEQKIEAVYVFPLPSRAAVNGAGRIEHRHVDVLENRREDDVGELRSGLRPFPVQAARARRIDDAARLLRRHQGSDRAETQATVARGTGHYAGDAGS